MIVTGANGSGKSAYGKQVKETAFGRLKTGRLDRFYGSDGMLRPGRERNNWDRRQEYATLPFSGTGGSSKYSPVYKRRSRCLRQVSNFQKLVKAHVQAASAFMIDLSQVSLALRGATDRSLIVLDEFGKGEYHFRALPHFRYRIRRWSWSSSRRD